MDQVSLNCGAANDLIDLLLDEDCLCLLLSSKHFHSFMKQFEFPASLEMIAAGGDETINEFQKFVFGRYRALHIEEIKLPEAELDAVANRKLQKLGINAPMPGAVVDSEFQKQVGWRRKSYSATNSFGAFYTHIIT